MRRATGCALSLTLFVAWPSAAREGGQEKPMLEPLLNRCDNALARLRFRNRGVVTRDLRFAHQRCRCYYVEGVDHWSVPWGSGGSSSYRYLFQIEPQAERARRPDIVFEDFESGRYDKWKVEGEAFGTAPSRAGSIHHHQPLRGWQGKFLVDSFLNDGSKTATAEASDRPQGKLTSKPFRVERDAIMFLIGGGAHAGRTCLNLRVGGKVVRTATGDNTETLVRKHWDVRDLAGKEAVLEMVDAHSGGWGHVMVDHIVFSDAPPRRGITPPTGMRSAVPLGGLGAGTIELRADGSLRDWNVFNNSPAGGGQKVHLDDALFGLRIQPQGGKAKAWALRTHPPDGLPAIAQIEYAGAFPVSRLRFADPELPIAVDLFAYCEFRIRNPEASATPAILFTFNLHNPSDKPIDGSLLFNLPNHVGGTFFWERGLILRKLGSSPTSGSMALRLAEGDLGFAARDDLKTLWSLFADTGMLDAGFPTNTPGKHGAVATTITLAPGQSRSLTLVMAWYFPYRPHGSETVGNHYTTRYHSAGHVADRVARRITHTWEAIEAWHGLCFDNSLPHWLQDAMVNSAATMLKTGMWFADGRWRQWESFSCAAVDPIHIHFYRSLPYALFFPSLQQNVLRGYAKAQADDGYIREHLADRNGSDRPGGRMMGDGCTTFLLDIYVNYLWTADEAFLDAIWPHARKAAQWQIRRCTPHGLPHNLNNTYDWWAFEHKHVVAYNAFLHLAALRAAERLATVQGDADLADACRTNLASARQALDKLLWTGRHYRAWWMKDAAFPDALHADTLYGQLWASLLGLGHVADPERLRAHLAAEMHTNASPFGLKVMQHTASDRDTRDNLVWQAGSIDWCALNLTLGGDVAASLAEAQKVVDVWRHHLRDQWDWRDLTTAWDGLPWCNSHYARQLTFWAIPLALSGQHYSAPAKALAFDPRLSAPARLPFFVPTASGTLDLRDGGTATLTVLSGHLKLNELRIGKAALKRPLTLGEHESIDLH